MVGSDNFKVDFKINKDVAKDEVGGTVNPAATGNIQPKEKHSYQEFSPTYSVCKICNKPETDDIHLKSPNEYVTVSPQDQAMQVYNKPLAEVGEPEYSSGVENEEEEITSTPYPQTIPELSRQNRPSNQTDNMSTLVQMLTDLDTMVDGESLTNENFQMANTLLNDATSLLEELKDAE